MYSARPPACPAPRGVGGRFHRALSFSLSGGWPAARVMLPVCLWAGPPLPRLTTLPALPGLCAPRLSGCQLSDSLDVCPFTDLEVPCPRASCQSVHPRLLLLPARAHSSLTAAVSLLWQLALTSQYQHIQIEVNPPSHQPHCPRPDSRQRVLA